jgi:hypothetical protein
MPELTIAAEVGGVVLTMTHFSPAEAEKITVTPQHLQRMWRSRGYLPSHDGTARFDLFSLCEMLSLKLLADRTGPLLARHIATVCGHAIAWRVLSWVDAYEGETDRVGEWDPEPFARGKRIQQRNRELLAQMQPGGGGLATAAALLAEGRAIIDQEGGPGFDQLGWLRDTVIRQRGIEVCKQRFLLWFADGKYELTDSLDASFNDRGSGDPRFAGAVLTLDLGALASVIIERSGRAFVCVEIPIGGVSP